MEYAHKLFSTRGGTLALAGLTALIAAIAVFAYVKHYRSSVQEGGVPATVLVVVGPDRQGNAGQRDRDQAPVPGADDSREPAPRGRDQRSRPACAGRVAKTDILPRPAAHRDRLHLGQGRARGRAGRVQRAITISIDSAHGMIGQIAERRPGRRLRRIQRRSRRRLGRPIGAGQSRPGSAADHAERPRARRREVEPLRRGRRHVAR